MSVKASRSVLVRARKIRCLFLDIDGVLTDGKLYIGPNCEETKTNYVRDGYGIKALLKSRSSVFFVSNYTLRIYRPADNDISGVWLI